MIELRHSSRNWSLVIVSWSSGGRVYMNQQGYIYTHNYTWVGEGELFPHEFAAISFCGGYIIQWTSHPGTERRYTWTLRQVASSACLSPSLSPPPPLSLSLSKYIYTYKRLVR